MPTFNIWCVFAYILSWKSWFLDDKLELDGVINFYLLDNKHWRAMCSIPSFDMKSKFSFLIFMLQIWISFTAIGPFTIALINGLYNFSSGIFLIGTFQVVFVIVFCVKQQIQLSFLTQFEISKLTNYIKTELSVLKVCSRFSAHFMFYLFSRLYV